MKYVTDLLSKVGLLGVKLVEIPIDSNSKTLAHDDLLLEDPGQYMRLVCKLIYFTLARPYISFAVSVVIHYMQNPRKPYFDAILRILRYFKKTSGQRLLFRCNGHLNMKATLM